MAKYLRAIGWGMSAAMIGLGGLFGIAANAQQAMHDPTQPPDVGYGAAVDAGVSSGPVLQSVLIAPDRRVAVISGETVHVGEKVGTAKVVRIAEGEVVLRTGKELETLRLFPLIEKHAGDKAPSPGRK